MRRPVTAFVFAVLAGATCALAQSDDFSKVEIKATKLGGTVWMLTGAGGNIGVSGGSDGLLIVDDQFAPLADKIKTALKQISPGRLAFVLNTHFHGDHTGGNPAFGKDATIVAQDNVRKRLSTKETGAGEAREPMPKDGLPVVTFADGVTVWFNGEQIDVVHVPAGHTDGDSVIFFRGSNVVHMGDQFFNGMFPFIDLASGGSVQGYIRNVGSMIGRMPAGAKVIPGHGPVGTVDDLKKFHAMLVATSDIVRSEIERGVSLQDAEKAGLPEEWKSWATGFVPVERWVEMLYTGLSKAEARGH